MSRSYKKIRSISEGNFHSCYAANKAEKLKLHGVKQGIESCALSQLTKIRKEEKQLARLHASLRLERERHQHEDTFKRAFKKLLLRESKDSSHSLASNSTTTPTLKKSIEDISRANPKKAHINEIVPFYLEKDYSCYHQDSHISVHLDKIEKIQEGFSSSDHKQNKAQLLDELARLNTNLEGGNQSGSSIAALKPLPSRRSSTSFSKRRSSLSTRKTSAPSCAGRSTAKIGQIEEAGAKEQRSSKDLTQKSTDLTEITDPHKQVETCVQKQLKTSHTPNIKRTSKKKATIIPKLPSFSTIVQQTITSKKQSPQIENNINLKPLIAGENESFDANKNEDERSVSCGRPSSSSSSHVVTSPRRASALVAATFAIGTGSVLTPLERQELDSKFFGTKLSTSHIHRELETRWKGLLDAHLKQKTTHDEGRIKLLRRIVKPKDVESDSTVEEIEKFFEILDKYDEDKFYPAYDPSRKFNIEDFRFLRKCKYLRLTKMNWDSLRSSFIQSLQEQSLQEVK